MELFLSVGQILISILLIVVILLQQRGTALGSAFGGGSGGASYGAQRGTQGKLFQATIIFSILFLLFSFLNLLF